MCEKELINQHELRPGINRHGDIIADIRWEAHRIPQWIIDGIRPPILEGIPRIEQIVNVEFLKNFVLENKLDEFNPSNLFNLELANTIMPESVVNQMKIKPKEWFGGLKVAHLHLNGKIFLMKEKQWDVLSNQLKVDMANKIQHTQKIDFDQARGLANAMNSM